MLPLLETVLDTFRMQTPSERLARLQRDRQVARANIRRVLGGLARRNGIAQSAIDHAIDEFADALLEDATADAEDEIALDLGRPNEEA